jgi:pyruvate formate lyase activating enzyme
MVIGGFQKASLLDFPGKIAAIIFTRGCNFRCPYCHNPELVDPAQFSDSLDKEQIIRFLATRIAKLQGIVVTGGEPTIHPDLPSLLEELKQFGFSIKLDTNGSNPILLKTLFDRGLVDYCAMDVKTTIASYPKNTSTTVDPRRIIESIEIIQSSRIAHEFRTTYVDSLLSSEDVLAIGKMIKESPFYIQPFRPTKTLDEEYLCLPEPTEEKLRSIQALLAAEGILCDIR